MQLTLFSPKSSQASSG